VPLFVLCLPFNGARLRVPASPNPAERSPHTSTQNARDSRVGWLVQQAFLLAEGPLQNLLECEIHIAHKGVALEHDPVRARCQAARSLGECLLGDYLSVCARTCVHVRVCACTAQPTSTRTSPKKRRREEKARVVCLGGPVELHAHLWPPRHRRTVEVVGLGRRQAEPPVAEPVG
jgi:hypothetical protein